jgi:UDP-glucose:(heptosyl)LPS alpha-1,3-glucosyltransferase
MERYVWELTLQLRQLGHRVTVICERCHTLVPQGISVIELGEVSPRPRWISALRFSHRVANWLAANPQTGSILHSHERIHSHDITTFHSTIFATVKEKPWWRLISLRIAMQLYLERRELSVAKVIVPNSQNIKQQLAFYYPEFAHKLSEPVTPGVTAMNVREFRTVPKDGGIIGFVGEEWKRKGLTLAVAIVKRLRLSRPNLTFVVNGPNAASIKHLFDNWQSGFILKEWSGQVNYAEIDVLLHPAKSEPYGMVVSEAMASKVPVVISDACGACEDVTAEAGTILSLDSPIDLWVNAVNHQLCRVDSVPQFSRGWNEVASEYEQIFRSFVSQKCSESGGSTVSSSVDLDSSVPKSSLQVPSSHRG